MTAAGSKRRSRLPLAHETPRVWTFERPKDAVDAVGEHLASKPHGSDSITEDKGAG